MRIYHEMDITKFIDAIDEKKAQAITVLKLSKALEWFHACIVLLTSDYIT